MKMKLIVEIDTAKPLDAERLQAEIQFLQHIVDNGADFLSNAPGNANSAFVASASTSAPATPAIPAPPSAAATAPAVEPGEQKVDSTGLPWDERIHSGTKGINADGTWKARRGTTPALKAQVEHELRSGSAPAAPAAPSTVPGAAANMVPPPPAAATSAPAIPAPPASPEAAAVPPPPAAPQVNLLQALSQAVMQGKTTIDSVMAEIQKYGVGDLGQLAANPLASAAVEKYFREQGVI